MSDIAEFLLARVRENEVGAEMLAKRDGERGIRSDWLGFLPGRGPLAAQLLAECQAKRQLIEQVSDVTWGGYAVRDRVLLLLAQPYADHPDFDPDWRLDAHV